MRFFYIRETYLQWINKSLKACLRFNEITDVHLCEVYIVHTVKDCCEDFNDRSHEDAITVLSRSMNDVCTLEQVKKKI